LTNTRFRGIFNEAQDIDLVKSALKCSMSMFPQFLEIFATELPKGNGRLLLKGLFPSLVPTFIKGQLSPSKSWINTSQTPTLVDLEVFLIFALLEAQLDSIAKVRPKSDIELLFFQRTYQFDTSVTKTWSKLVKELGQGEKTGSERLVNVPHSLFKPVLQEVRQVDSTTLPAFGIVGLIFKLLSKANDLYSPTDALYYLNQYASPPVESTLKQPLFPGLKATPITMKCVSTTLHNLIHQEIQSSLLAKNQSQIPARSSLAGRASLAVRASVVSTPSKRVSFVSEGGKPRASEARTPIVSTKGIPGAFQRTPHPVMQQVEPPAKWQWNSNYSN